MLEVALCSLFTILPDFLFRRYWQRRQITMYSIWFELRWGITACLMLTVVLITIIFYYHPSTTSAAPLFRTVAILPETNGRVSEIYVKWRDKIEKGAPIFKLDSTKQEADLELAKRRIVEVDAAMVMAQADIAAAEGKIIEAKGALQQAQDELDTKQELRQRNADVVAEREIERLTVMLDGRKGAVAGADAAKQAAETRLSTLLPAQKASADAALKQAQVELDKTVVYAGVSGLVEQFTLRVGDIVNPFMRPAGLLIPAEAGRKALDGRLQPDRSASDAGRHGGGSDLRLEADDHHSDGRHRRAGLHRCRSIPRRRAADRRSSNWRSPARSWSSWSRCTRAGSTA